MYRKLGAELLGTAILVFIACGVAVLTLGTWTATASGGINPGGVAAGIVATSLAFGLVLAGLAYVFGPISGCHVNPAVTLGALLTRRLSLKDAGGYWVAQFLGGIIGAGILKKVLSGSLAWNNSVGLGADGYGRSSMIHISATGAFVTEVILTTIFVAVILAVTSKQGPGALAGLLIGLTLTLVHLFGIAVTGTSVNPARSFGPALLLGGTALSQVWLFIVAPLVGGALAAGLHRYFYND